MTDLLKSMTAASSGMTAQTARLRLVSENIANVDTPGYRRKLVTFTDQIDQPGEDRAVSAGRVYLDRADLERVYDPAHPLADANGYFDGSNVNLMVEIADAREAQRSYEANLRMFDQSKRMVGALFELMRR